MIAKMIPVLLFCLLLSGCGGCSSFTIEPDSASDGTYSTQTSMSSLEYSIYMSKQITLFTNQLTATISIIQTDYDYENALDLANENLDSMEDAYEEVTVTMPATTAEDDREMVMEAMETAIGHMEQYIEALENGEAVDGFKSAFQQDFNALTSLSTLYYQ